MKTTPATSSQVIHLPAHLFASAGDKTRPFISSAYVDGEERSVVATNGRSMAILTIPFKGTLRTGFITPELWAKVKKDKKPKEPFALDPIAGTLNGIPYPEKHPEGHNFPRWKSVVPAFQPSHRIHFDPELLFDLAQSLRNDPKQKAVTLEFSPDGEAPIRILTSAGQGVLMPMKIEGFGPSGQLERSNGKRATKAENPAPAPPIEREPARQAPETPATPTPAPTPVNAPSPEAARPKFQGPKAKPRAEAVEATAPPELTRNEKRNGIELRFNGKPSEAVRDSMKAHGFRWLPSQPGQPWAARYSEEAWVFATSLAEARSTTTHPVLPESTSEQVLEAPPNINLDF